MGGSPLSFEAPLAFASCRDTRPRPLTSGPAGGRGPARASGRGGGRLPPHSHNLCAGLVRHADVCAYICMPMRPGEEWVAFKMAERGGRGSGGHGSLDKSITLPPDEIFRNLENAKRFAIDIGNREGTAGRRGPAGSWG